MSYLLDHPVLQGGPKGKTLHPVYIIRRYASRQNAYCIGAVGLRLYWSRPKSNLVTQFVMVSQGKFINKDVCYSRPSVLRRATMLHRPTSYKQHKMLRVSRIFRLFCGGYLWLQSRLPHPCQADVAFCILAANFWQLYLCWNRNGHLLIPLLLPFVARSQLRPHVAYCVNSIIFPSDFCLFVNVFCLWKPKAYRLGF